jgi:hypothetical protein
VVALALEIIPGQPIVFFLVVHDDVDTATTAANKKIIIANFFMLIIEIDNVVINCFCKILLPQKRKQSYIIYLYLKSFNNTLLT